MPLISVIVPVYNVSTYLKACIDSILNQSLTDIEIILINDGSTDDSGVICKSYTDRRIKYIYQDNKGLSGARNTGIKNATGKYICFVDSDDYINPDYCKAMYDIAEQKNADVVMCGIARVSEQGEFLYYSNENLASCVKSLDDGKLRPFIYKYFTGARDNMAAWNKLYLRSFINNNSLLFNEKIRFVEDAPFCYEVLCCAKIYAVTDKVLYYYRRRENSLTGTSRNADYVPLAFSMIYSDINNAFVKHNKMDLLYKMEPVIFARILQMEFFFLRQKLGRDNLCCKAVLPNIKNHKKLLWRTVFGRELAYYTRVIKKDKTFLNSMRGFAATCAMGYYPMLVRQIFYNRRTLKK